jgi:hypothetical protein
VKTEDLFAGSSVTITPHDDVWLVSLHTDSLQTVTMRTYHELPGALDAAHEWMLMLADETEIAPDAVGAVHLLMETLARHAVDEGATLPATMEDLEARGTLRTWFEREMENRE